MSKIQKEAEAFAAKVQVEGIAKMTSRQAQDSTLRVYIANILGAGKYVSFRHKNTIVFMTREGIDHQLKQVG